MTDPLSASTTQVVDRPRGQDALRILAAALVCGAAILLFAVHVRPLGYVPLVAGRRRWASSSTGASAGTSPSSPSAR